MKEININISRNTKGTPIKSLSMPTPKRGKPFSIPWDRPFVPPSTRSDYFFPLYRRNKIYKGPLPISYITSFDEGDIIYFHTGLRTINAQIQYYKYARYDLLVIEDFFSHVLYKVGREGELGQSLQYFINFTKKLRVMSLVGLLADAQFYNQMYANFETHIEEFENAIANLSHNTTKPYKRALAVLRLIIQRLDYLLNYCHIARTNAFNRFPSNRVWTEKLANKISLKGLPKELIATNEDSFFEEYISRYKFVEDKIIDNYIHKFNITEDEDLLLIPKIHHGIGKSGIYEFCQLILQKWKEQFNNKMAEGDPTTYLIKYPLLLCRICENKIPADIMEAHTENCLEKHKKFNSMKNIDLHLLKKYVNYSRDIQAIFSNTENKKKHMDNRRSTFMAHQFKSDTSGMLIKYGEAGISNQNKRRKTLTKHSTPSSSIESREDQQSATTNIMSKFNTGDDRKEGEFICTEINLSTQNTSSIMMQNSPEEDKKKTRTNTHIINDFALSGGISFDTISTESQDMMLINKTKKRGSITKRKSYFGMKILEESNIASSPKDISKREKFEKELDTKKRKIRFQKKGKKDKRIKGTMYLRSLANPKDSNSQLFPIYKQKENNVKEEGRKEDNLLLRPPDRKNINFTPLMRQRNPPGLTPKAMARNLDRRVSFMADYYRNSETSRKSYDSLSVISEEKRRPSIKPRPVQIPKGLNEQTVSSAKLKPPTTSESPPEKKTPTSVQVSCRTTPLSAGIIQKIRKKLRNSKTVSRISGGSGNSSELSSTHTTPSHVFRHPEKNKRHNHDDRLFDGLPMLEDFEATLIKPRNEVQEKYIFFDQKIEIVEEENSIIDTPDPIRVTSTTPTHFDLIRVESELGPAKNTETDDELELAHSKTENIPLLGHKIDLSHTSRTTTQSPDKINVNEKWGMRQIPFRRHSISKKSDISGITKFRMNEGIPVGHKRQNTTIIKGVQNVRKSGSKSSECSTDIEMIEQFREISRDAYSINSSLNVASLMEVDTILQKLMDQKAFIKKEKTMKQFEELKECLQKKRQMLTELIMLDEQEARILNLGGEKKQQYKQECRPEYRPECRPEYRPEYNLDRDKSDYYSGMSSKTLSDRGNLSERHKFKSSSLLPTFGQEYGLCESMSHTRFSDDSEANSPSSQSRVGTGSRDLRKQVLNNKYKIQRGIIERHPSPDSINSFFTPAASTDVPFSLLSNSSINLPPSFECTEEEQEIDHTYLSFISTLPSKRRSLSMHAKLNLFDCKKEDVVKRRNSLIVRTNNLYEITQRELWRSQSNLGDYILPKDDSGDSSEENISVDEERSKHKGSACFTRPLALRQSQSMKELLIKGHRETFTVARPPKIQDFKILKPISQGAFGKVVQAQKINTGDVFAIKILDRKKMVEKNDFHFVEHEQKILNELSNEFVVGGVYTFQSDKYLYFVMEYMTGGDLGALKALVPAFEEEPAKKYLAEIVLAVEYLHSKDIIHRDLKPDNILIDGDGHLKLIDFGLSELGSKSHAEGGIASPIRRVSPATFNPSISQVLWRTMGKNSSMFPEKESVAEKPILGTPDYIAPEIIEGIEHTKGVDWWAVGVMAYELLVGITPFGASVQATVFDKILNRRLKWPPNIGYGEDDMTPEAKDFIDKLLQVDPQKRLGLAQIKAHPFFHGIDWQNIRKQKALYVPKVDNISDMRNFNLSKGNFDIDDFGKEKHIVTPDEENEWLEEAERKFKNFSSSVLETLAKINLNLANEVMSKRKGRGSKYYAEPISNWNLESAKYISN